MGIRASPGAARAGLAGGRRLAEAEELRAHLELSPAGSVGHRLALVLTGARIPLPTRATGEARDFSLTGALTLGPELVASELRLSAATLQLEGIARLRELHVSLPPLRLDEPGGWWPATAEVAAGPIETHCGALHAVAACA